MTGLGGGDPLQSQSRSINQGIIFLRVRKQFYEANRKPSTVLRRPKIRWLRPRLTPSISRSAIQSTNINPLMGEHFCGHWSSLVQVRSQRLEKLSSWKKKVHTKQGLLVHTVLINNCSFKTKPFGPEENPWVRGVWNASTLLFLYIIVIARQKKLEALELDKFVCIICAVVALYLILFK